MLEGLNYGNCSPILMDQDWGPFQVMLGDRRGGTSRWWDGGSAFRRRVEKIEVDTSGEL